MKTPIHFPNSLIDGVRMATRPLSNNKARGTELITTYVKDQIFQHVKREVSLLDWTHS